jgi:hypothetical protein
MLEVADTVLAGRRRIQRRASRTPAARRKRAERARHQAGFHHYGMWLSDRAVEGMSARPRTVSGRLISLGAPTKHRRHCSMPQPRRRRHGPQPHRRRALELLAASRHGATEAILLASVFLLLTEVAGLAGMMKCRLQGLSTRRRVSLFTVAIFFIAH